MDSYKNMMSGYANRFIHMYSISFIDNTLLNKLMANVLPRSYEIFLTFFPFLLTHNNYAKIVNEWGR